MKRIANTYVYDMFSNTVSNSFNLYFYVYWIGSAITPINNQITFNILNF